MSSVTPNRQTKIAIDVSTTNCLRQPFAFPRDAQQMVPTYFAPDSALNSYWVVKHPYTVAWTMELFGCDPAEALVNSVATAGYKIVWQDSSNSFLAENWVAKETYKKPTDLPGVTPSADLPSTGNSVLIQRVPATSTFGKVLTAPEPVSPPTPPPPNLNPNPSYTLVQIPVNPVMTSKSTYEPNQSFILRFHIPLGGAIPDTVCRLSFGGSVTTTPTDRSGSVIGGRFDLAIRGDGRAILFEFTSSGWQERFEFRWGNPSQEAVNPNSVVGYYGTIIIQPFANDKITFRTRWQSLTAKSSGFIHDYRGWGGGIAVDFGSQNDASAGPKIGGAGVYTYKNYPEITGIQKLDFSTGPGNIILYCRDDNRGPVAVGSMRYPESGQLLDAPFLVPGAVSNADIFTVQGRTWKLGGTSITAQMYTQNGVALTSAGTNRFYAVAGVNAYRVKITFNSSSDRVQTPVLYSYQVLLEGLFQSYVPATTYLTTYIQATAFSGPGTSVSEDSFQAVIQDRHGELPNLYTRTGQRAQLRIYNATTGAIRSILGEGYVFRNTATPLGQDGGYPAYGTWKQYDLNVNGQWERLTRKRLKTHLTLGEDPNAASNVLNIGGNGKMPYFIEDAIGLLLQCGGFASTQYITPPYTFRLMAADPDLLTIPAGTQVSEALLHLIEDWLNGYLIWDPTAGATGSWRIIRPPVYKVGTTAMASFTEAVGGAKLPMYTAEGSSTAEMVHGTFKRTPIKPAANVLILRGSRGVVAAYTNTRSFNAGGSSTADPTHVDFIGEEVPLVWINPAVDNQAAANLLIRRLARFAAFGYYEYEWVAPYLLLSATQTGDSYQNASYDRPLRIGDVVSVEGPTGTANVMIRRVKWLGDHDVTQMASYQAISIL